MRRLLQLSKLHLNGQDKRSGGGGVGEEQEEGGNREGVETDGRVHGRRGVVEMVPEGGHDRGERKVGGAVTQIREADPPKDMVFGRTVLGCWGGCAWKRVCTGDTVCRRTARRGRLEAGMAGTGIGCLSTFWS